MKKVLIIEDNKSLNLAYADILKQNGYEVLSAIGGADGLILVIEKKPDIILLDLMLPDMPGEKVLGTLKENQESASIPVVVMSNKSEEASRNNCLNVLGAADYIVKVDSSIQDLVDIVGKNIAL